MRPIHPAQSIPPTLGAIHRANAPPNAAQRGLVRDGPTNLEPDGACGSGGQSVREPERGWSWSRLACSGGLVAMGAGRGPAAAGAGRDGGWSWACGSGGLVAMGAGRGPAAAGAGRDGGWSWACGSGGWSRWGLVVGLRQEQGPAGADRPGGTNRPVAAQHGRWPGWPEAPGAGHAPADVRAGRRGRKPGTAEPTEQGTARTGLKGQTGGCRMLAAERTMQTRPVERNLGGWVGQPWQDAAGACSW